MSRVLVTMAAAEIAAANLATAYNGRTYQGAKCVFTSEWDGKWCRTSYEVTHPLFSFSGGRLKHRDGRIRNHWSEGDGQTPFGVWLRSFAPRFAPDDLDERLEEPKIVEAVQRKFPALLKPLTRNETKLIVAARLLTDVQGLDLNAAIPTLAKAAGAVSAPTTNPEAAAALRAGLQRAIARRMRAAV